MKRAPLLLVLFALASRAEEPDPALQKRVEKSCAAISAVIEDYLGEKKFEAPVPVLLVTPQFIADFALEMEDRMAPGEEAAYALRMAVRMKQIPPGYDLRAQQAELLKQQVAGLYDADKDCYYVVDRVASVGTPMFTVTAAHELVHAYRDVDKDFWPRVLAAIDHDADWAVAISCLVEGDATLLGQGIGFASIQGNPPGPVVTALADSAGAMAAQMRAMFNAPGLREYPLALREMLLGRYAIGLVFAAEVFKQGGLEALDAAYDQPPRSTEQILHPEKFLGPEVDEPTVLTGGDPTAALGDGWALRIAHVLGEFEASILFTETLGRDRARRAADGWDGARYFFCEREGAPGFVGLVSVWDSADEAREFAGAWADWAAQRDGAKGEIDDDRKSTRRIRSADGLVVVRLDGTRVLVADGVPPDRVDDVLAALAAAKSRDRRADENPVRTG